MKEMEIASIFYAQLSEEDKVIFKLSKRFTELMEDYARFKEQFKDELE